MINIKKLLPAFMIIFLSTGCINSGYVTNKIAFQEATEVSAETKDNIIVADNQVSTEQKKTKETLLSTFSTQYGSWDINRTHNMQLAADKINNNVLEPNGIFSFNDIVGERTEKNGFKLSTIFVDKEKVQGYGGGICQVSTTLYNSVLQTTLEVTERHPHKRKVIYVPEGKDATVSYGKLDFKFKNTYTHPIKIKATMKDDVLTTEIYKIEQY